MAVNTLFPKLPAELRRSIARQPLLCEGQRAYLQSKAPRISNKAFWERIVEDFEKHKLDDHTLDPHINKMINMLNDKTKWIIEFGCGIGRTADILRNNHYFNYLGIDIAPRAVELAGQIVPGMAFRTGDIVNFYPGRIFDAAIATDVLLYQSPEDQIRALLNMGRSLVPGAPLLTRWAPGKEWIGLKKREISQTEIVEGWVFHANAGYLEQLFKVAGFEIIQLPGYQRIHPESIILKPGTEFAKPQDYLVVFAIFTRNI